MGLKPTSCILCRSHKALLLPILGPFEYVQPLSNSTVAMVACHPQTGVRGGRARALTSLIILNHFWRPLPPSTPVGIFKAAQRIFTSLNIPNIPTGQANICVTLGFLGTTDPKTGRRGALHIDIDSKRNLQTHMPRVISELQTELTSVKPETQRRPT